jgi:hypothetical protein
MAIQSCHPQFHLHNVRSNPIFWTAFGAIILELEDKPSAEELRKIILTPDSAINFDITVSANSQLLPRDLRSKMLANYVAAAVPYLDALIARNKRAKHERARSLVGFVETSAPISFASLATISAKTHGRTRYRVLSIVF